MGMSAIAHAHCMSGLSASIPPEDGAGSCPVRMTLGILEGRTQQKAACQCLENSMASSCVRDLQTIEG